MRRLFNAHVRLVYKDERGEASVSSSVADRTAFWWNERKPNEPSLWDSKIDENGGAKLDHRAANRSCFWAE